MYTKAIHYSIDWLQNEYTQYTFIAAVYAVATLGLNMFKCLYEKKILEKETKNEIKIIKHEQINNFNFYFYYNVSFGNKMQMF